MESVISPAINPTLRAIYQYLESEEDVGEGERGTAIYDEAVVDRYLAEIEDLCVSDYGLSSSEAADLIYQTAGEAGIPIPGRGSSKVEDSGWRAQAKQRGFARLVLARAAKLASK